MMLLNDRSRPRFQTQLLVVMLFLSLQFLVTPVISSAAEQETPRRHSLIHRSPAESAALPATTTEGTILQPPGAEPPRITSPIEPPKPSASLSTMPSPLHRALTKHPAIATITAPAPPSQAVPGALTSGIAAGQVMQTTADTPKSTIPPATVPMAKSASGPLSGVISTGAAPIAQTAPSPFAGATSGNSVASTGGNSSSSSHGSRSMLNLLHNPAIAGLMQPATPVVTTPPSSPPPSAPPSTPPSTPPATPPSSPSTGSLTLTWTANGEPDLAGYKIYVGTASGTYSFPGSPFVAGKVTSYTVSNLPKGQTYFFAMSAYDSAGNESPLSAEVSKTLY